MLNADLLLHVVDCSDEHFKEQMKTTGQTLEELEAGEIPVITVFNKSDKCEGVLSYPQFVGENKIYISAKDEASLKALSELICQRVYAGYQRAEFLIPYEKGEILSYFMENAHILEREFEEKGTRLCVSCHRADQEKYKEWLIHGKGTVK